MHRPHRPSARRSSAARSVAAVLALALAAPSLAAGGFEDRLVFHQGCSSVDAAGDLVLETCVDPGIACSGSSATIATSVPGTFTVDMAYELTATMEFTQAIIDVASAGSTDWVKNPPFGQDGFCEPVPCAGLDTGITFHVEAGDSVSFVLTNNGQPCTLPSPGGIRVIFRDLVFTPDPGVADLGRGLDAATLVVGRVAPPQRTGRVTALDVAGDLDGDGFRELVVGTAFTDEISGDLGRTRVLSGADGALLHEVVGQPGSWTGYDVAALGDLDGDGVDDFATGEPRQGGDDRGRVRVWSGADGALLWATAGAGGDQMGTAVDGVDDVDGDGVPDVVAGAPGADVGWNRDGAVRLLSGVDGSLLREWGGNADSENWGSAVAGFPDVDGDGVPDVAGASVRAMGNAGVVKVWSGATGIVIHRLTGALFEALGSSLADAGDLDGDGVHDLLIGADSTDLPGLSGAGAVVAVSGATGTGIFLRFGTASGQRLGDAVSGAGDVDGDGLDDVVLSDARSPLGPRARVLRGVDGAPLLDVESDVHEVGFDVAGGHDLDGDGVPDVVVSARTIVGEDVVVAFSGDAADHGAPTLGVTGALAPGGLVTLDVAGAPPSRPAALVAGLAAAEQPFANGVLVPSLDLVRLGYVTDAAGALSIGIVWPTTAPAGFYAVAQVWTSSPDAASGYEATNAVALVP